MCFEIHQEKGRAACSSQKCGCAIRAPEQLAIYLYKQCLTVGFYLFVSMVCVCFLSVRYAPPFKTAARVRRGLTHLEDEEDPLRS